MKNVIYRGPAAEEPQTVNLPVAGAYLPGVLVTSDGAELTVATGADDEKGLLVLSNLRLAGQDLATAYTADDTAVAYRTKPDQEYQVRMAAGTYAVGDPLTPGAAGVLAAAATGNVVVAFYNGVTTALSANDLADVKIANSFKAS